jgi:hypothetical protein
MPILSQYRMVKADIPLSRRQFAYRHRPKLLDLKSASSFTVNGMTIATAYAAAEKDCRSGVRPQP